MQNVSTATLNWKRGDHQPTHDRLRGLFLFIEDMSFALLLVLVVGCHPLWVIWILAQMFL